MNGLAGSGMDGDTQTLNAQTKDCVNGNIVESFSDEEYSQSEVILTDDESEIEDSSEIDEKGQNELSPPNRARSLSSNSLGLFYVLGSKLYSCYQCREHTSLFKGLSEYYYPDFLNLLKAVYALPWLSGPSVISLQSYLSGFQKAVDYCLYKIEEDADAAKKSFLERKAHFIDISEDSVKQKELNFAPTLRTLELSLHNLTEKALLKAVEDVLENTYSDVQSIKSIDTGHTDPIDNPITRIANAINEWGEFIERLTKIYAVEEGQIQKRDQYLSNWHVDTEAICYKTIIESVQNMVVRFVEHNQELQNIGVGLVEGGQKFQSIEESKLSKIETNLYFYEKAFKGKECLERLKGIASLEEEFRNDCKEAIQCFDRHRESFENECLAFFPHKMENLFERFERFYTEVLNNADSTLSKKYDLVELYRRMRNTYVAWSDFIALYSPSDLKKEEPAQVAHEKWQEKFHSSRALSKEFLEFLFGFFSELPKGTSVESFFSYENLKKKLTVLKTIKHLIEYLTILSEEPTAALSYNHYHTQLHTLEEEVKELYWQFNHTISNAKWLFQRKHGTPFRKYNPCFLRQMIGAASYYAAISKYDPAISLCENYFCDSLWPVTCESNYTRHTFEINSTP